MRLLEASSLNSIHELRRVRHLTLAQEAGSLWSATWRGQGCLCVLQEDQHSRHLTSACAYLETISICLSCYKSKSSRKEKNKQRSIWIQPIPSSDTQAHPILWYIGLPHPQIHRFTRSSKTQAHPIHGYTGPPDPLIHRSTSSLDTQVTPNTQAYPILRYTGPPQIHRPTPDTQAHPTLGYTGPPHPQIHRSTPSSDTQVVSLFYISQTYLEYLKVKCIICPNHPHLYILYKPKWFSI